MAGVATLGAGNTLGRVVSSLAPLKISPRPGKGPNASRGPRLLGKRPSEVFQSPKARAVKEGQGAQEDDLTTMLSRPGSLNGASPSTQLSERPPAFSPKDPHGDEEHVSDGFWSPFSISAVAALVVGLGFYFKDDIKVFLDVFEGQVEQMGPLGYAAYGVVYTVLELLIVPATPLTLAAGYLFGPVPGTAVVSVSATTAAVLAFLISRFALRDRVRDFADGNKQFVAIDKAIKKDGFKFVFLLRLSPLLPFAASNYLYGLTSVDLAPYALASWIGMLPGTWAYVNAGSVGRDLAESGPEGVLSWQLGLAVVATLGVIWFVGNLAKDALDHVDDEETA